MGVFRFVLFYFFIVALCTNIPLKFKDSNCNTAAGSIEIHYISERRRLSRAQQEDKYYRVKEILNGYANTISEDMDIVDGFVYEEMSRREYAIVPRPDEGTGHDESNLTWIVSSFLTMAVSISMVLFYVLKRSERRWKDAVDKDEDKDHADRNLELLIEADDLKCEEFPVKSIEPVVAEEIISGEVVSNRESVYDYGLVCIAESIDEEEEFAVQRNQLLREYNIPTIVNNLDEDDNEVLSTGGQLCGDGFGFNI